MEWVLVIAGLVLGLMFLTSYESGGVPVGCLIVVVVLILGAVILTR